MQDDLRMDLSASIRLKNLLADATQRKATSEITALTALAQKIETKNNPALAVK